MAAVLGTRYSECFAAVGVHSGLACGAARGVASAFAAMRGTGAVGGGMSRRPLRTIVLHGSTDGTVHPTNHGRVVSAQADAGGAILSRHGAASGGRRFTATATATAVRRADGATLTEFWPVEGAGHAWSGGASAGSDTDPSGPDASAEMIRFFRGGAFEGAAR